MMSIGEMVYYAKEIFLLLFSFIIFIFLLFLLITQGINAETFFYMGIVIIFFLICFLLILFGMINDIKKRMNFNIFLKEIANEKIFDVIKGFPVQLKDNSNNAKIILGIAPKVSFRRNNISIIYKNFVRADNLSEKMIGILKEVKWNEMGEPNKEHFGKNNEKLKIFGVDLNSLNFIPRPEFGKDYMIIKYEMPSKDRLLKLYQLVKNELKKY